jgi:hypothetical protein
VIKRSALTLGFFLLGFVSLFAFGVLDAHMCATFAKLCEPKPGQCTELGKCGSSLALDLKVFAVYLGPSIVFAIAAAIASARRRSGRFWLLLTALLVIAHWTVMEAVRLS